MLHARPLALCALMFSTPALAEGVGFLCDPVVTHTNGMRLASTTSLRSHNAYWQCDPGHVGYCDGRAYNCLRNDLRGLGQRPHGEFVPPPTPLGATGTRTAHAPDGLEQGDHESLGMIASDAAQGPAREAAGGRRAFGGPAGSPLTPPTTGAPWLDAIQTLGTKIAPEG